MRAHPAIDVLNAAGIEVETPQQVEEVRKLVRRSQSDPYSLIVDLLRERSSRDGSCANPYWATSFNSCARMPSMQPYVHLLALAFMNTAAAEETLTTEPKEEAPSPKAEVLTGPMVPLDGDSLLFGETQVHLFGINAPDTDQLREWPNESRSPRLRRVCASASPLSPTQRGPPIEEGPTQER